MNQSIYGKAQAFVFSPFPLNLFPSSFNHIGRLEPNMAAHTSIRWTPSAWPRGGPAGLPLLRDKRQMEISHNTSCLNHIAGFSNPGLWLTYTGTYHYTFWSCRRVPDQRGEMHERWHAGLVPHLQTCVFDVERPEHASGISARLRPNRDAPTLHIGESNQRDDR